MATIIAALMASATPDLEPALAIIRRHEGLVLRTYADPVGLATIGYGHTGPDVRPGMRITREDAERLLELDAVAASHAIAQLVTVPLTRNQRSALVSFVYNVGVDAFRRSGLLRVLNRGDYKGAARSLSRWTHAGTRVLPGLVTRRMAEVELFLTPDNEDK